MRSNRCAECAKKDAAIAALTDILVRRAMRRLPTIRTGTLPDPTAGCPCRPENGGSGVCGCVLSGTKVTC